MQQLLVVTCVMALSGVVMIVPILLRRIEIGKRHNAYLTHMINSTPPGREIVSLWNHKCQHCLRSVRDQPVMTFRMNVGGGGDKVIIVFHAMRPRCNKAAWEWKTKTKEPL